MRLLEDPSKAWPDLIDKIRANAAELIQADKPLDLSLLDAGRKHLREANRNLWRVINDLEQILFNEQKDAVQAIEDIALTNGESFAYRLRRLIDAGIVDLRADRQRLRKVEGGDR